MTPPFATGIHHVTGITADVQANVDFYAGFLGLHLVKQTGGYEDAEQLHLFWGDAAGQPGTLVSFLVWPAAGRGRTGLGQVSELALRVPATSIGDWLTRALSARIPIEGPVREFGEPVLRLKDPDGMIVKLVGTGDGPLRIRGVTLLSEHPAQTAAFLARFGYRPGPVDGPFQRLISDTDVVDVRASAGFVPSIPGAGVADHVAFRARDVAAVQAMRLALRDHGPTHVHDRKYFLSLYVREPGHTLIEYATDGPGMTVDEPAGQLGRTLMIPPGDAARAADLRVMLPQFALPGEERFPMRDLGFVHRFHRPADPDGSTLVLLHGTGGNEADLFPLGHRIAPRATLLGVRGRSTEEGINRWFRRFDATTYDQADIAFESGAFAAFVHEATQLYDLNPATTTYLGYSNGANLLAAILQLYPEVVRQAILLRGLQPLEAPPAADLAGARVLMLTGARDPYGRHAPALEAALRQAGAEVTSEILPAGHELTGDDLDRAARWL